MKKITFNDPFLKKDYQESNEELYNMKNHVQYISIIYHKTETNICLSPIIHELKKKYSSYKSQDKKKNRYDEEQYIKYDELLRMLYESNLKCYYCKGDICLIYKNKNEKNQWSLERFNNNLGHYASNTCISCLKCNLQRRNDNHEYFKMSKNFVVTKKED